MNRKNLKDYKVFIFDVDGTLYSQKRMHKLMFGKLMQYYLLHLNKLGDLWTIYSFRKLREKEENKNISIDALCKKMAPGNNNKAEGIRNTINKWMFNEPIALLKKCAYTDVISFVQDNEKETIIYSDYPAKDKLLELNIKPRMVVTPEDKPELAEQKPSEKIMKYILEKSGVNSDEILYVGDRDDRDRKSAMIIEVDYLDIEELKELLH